MDRVDCLLDCVPGHRSSNREVLAAVSGPVVAWNTGTTTVDDVGLDDVGL